VNGVLVIDKPSGPTSHDVVARVRRALEETRIGHTGTLDPLATGVLPLVIGRATRLASFLSAGIKSYEADVRLGSATASYDAAERIAAGAPPPQPPNVTTTQIELLLGEFRGTYHQHPPPYSAKKIGGVAAHRLARRHTPVQPAAVTVTVSELELVSLQDGIARLSVTATAGFYVRTLAHELGARLGCGGHLEALRRTRAGIFTLSEATPLGVVESERQEAAARLVPMESLLPELPAIRLNERGADRASHGSRLSGEDFDDAAGSVLPSSASPRVRLMSPSGALLGIAEPAAGGILRPTIVLV
jgi:tRNA pseudouridine55 synthase